MMIPKSINSSVKTVGIVLLCVAGFFVAFFSLSFYAFLFAMVAIPVAIFLGYFSEVLGAFIFVSLFGILRNEILTLVSFWGELPCLTKTLVYIDSLVPFKQFLLVFFIVFSVRFFTSSVKIFNVVSSSSSNTKTKEIKPKKIQTEGQ